MDSASWDLLLFLWQNNTGAVILASYLRDISSEANGKCLKSVFGRFIGSPKDKDRLRMVMLQPLMLGPTKQLAEYLFHEGRVHGVEEQIYLKLQEMSGGNPLFIYELANAMLDMFVDSPQGRQYRQKQQQQQQQLQQQTQAAVKTQGDLTAQTPSQSVRQSSLPQQDVLQQQHHVVMAGGLFSRVVQDFRTARIEEVITFRFDQLDVPTQLLLKIASVAAANGQVFTLAMLNYMIQDDVESDTGVFSCLQIKRSQRNAMEMPESSSMRVTTDTSGAKKGGTTGLDAMNRQWAASTSIDSIEGMDLHCISSSLLPSVLSELLRRDAFIRVVRHRGHSQHEFLPVEDADVLDKLKLLDWDLESPLNFENVHTLSSYYIDFKIRLEQSTIYDLMLDEQKAALHDRVASFLKAQTAALSRAGKVCTAGQLFEEGFHWERASGWSSAMACYYRSATTLDATGSYEDSFAHLTASYRMLNAMRRDAGIEERNLPSLPATFQDIFSSSAGGGGAAGSTEDGAVARSTAVKQHLLTKENIYNIFGGDSSLLEVGINMLLRLGQANFTLSNAPAVVTSELYEDALQLIMITWNFDDDSVDSSANAPPSNLATAGRTSPSSSAADGPSVDLIASSASPARTLQRQASHRIPQAQQARSSLSATAATATAAADNGGFSSLEGAATKSVARTASTSQPPSPSKTKRARGVFGSHKNQHSKKETARVAAFGLQDPTTVFPILAGIAALYRNKQLVDSDDRSKESTIYLLLLELARSKPEYKPHLVVGLCLYRTLLSDQERRAEAMGLADEIRRLYDHEQHSDFLVDRYGNNRVPYTLALQVQLLRLNGCLSKSNEYIEVIIRKFLPSLTHLHSIGITVYPILSSLIVHGCKSTALEQFDRYLAIERERGGFSFFRDVNLLFREWIQLLLLHEEFEKTQDPSAYLEHMAANPIAVAIEKRILDRDFLPEDSSKRSLLLESLAEFGISAEHVCAGILFMKCRFTSRRSDMSRYEQVQYRKALLIPALEYINSSIDSALGNSKLIFGCFMSLVAKARILCSINTLDAFDVENRDQRWAEANDMLTACEGLGEPNDFHLITLYVGVFRERLNLDVELGNRLQVSALNGMRELNGDAVFIDAYPTLVQMFPVLERYNDIIDECRCEG